MALKRVAYFFSWLLGIVEVERKVENIRVEQEELKGDLRQTQQKTDSLRRLVADMRQEDWF